MAELAVALPVFLFVLLGTFQLLLTSYAQQVVLGAAQGGARLAAGRDVAPEVAEAVAMDRARDLLNVGLGRLPASSDVEAVSGFESVAVVVRVEVTPLVPLTNLLGLTTIRAESRASREVFRPGGGTVDR
jgi:hypothetical protein